LPGSILREASVIISGEDLAGDRCGRVQDEPADFTFEIGEHPDVRLPVMVVYDGFFTSHQKRRIEVFDDQDAVRQFLGTRPDFPTPFDMEHPKTFGPYMNDPDLINRTDSGT
jgi:pyruvate/2-oxoacid:ferredoxin oxidoreductase alpha subunit